MAKLQVLLEVVPSSAQAPMAAAAAVASAIGHGTRFEAMRVAETLLADLPGLGVDIQDGTGPIPLASGLPELPGAAASPAVAAAAVAAFASARRIHRGTPPEVAPTLAGSAASMVIPAEVTAAAMAKLADRPDVIVWPNSAVTLFGEAAAAGEAHELFGLLDLADSAGGTDCRPFRPGVPVATIRQLLGVTRLWEDGFRGQNIIVGILDEGVHRSYPVVGGHETATEKRWGRAPITSHGSMCAADILVAAPATRLYDYPFLGQPSSGGALAMFQAVLAQRAIDGTPHLTNNSYGFVGVPPRNQAPRHEIWDLNHPVHRKVREVVAAGVPCFFAAGNCGDDCPSSKCHPSGIGPGNSIHASNSLAEVITVAAVNSAHERIGYSSQGPGMFEREKPDIAAYSHFFGNFGPDRPGGLVQPFDNGTSAATPVACGVGAALLSAFADLTPAELKAALTDSAADLGEPGRDFLTGAGVVNAAAAYHVLRAAGRLPGAARPQLMARTGNSGQGGSSADAVAGDDSTGGGGAAPGQGPGSGRRPARRAPRPRSPRRK